MELQDTIVAIATPNGIGGVSIIRFSGKNAYEIANKMVVGGCEFKHAVMQYKTILGDSGVQDKGYVVVFLAPHSYTGEEVVELHLHGSRALCSKIIMQAVKLGARLASRGEFTKRAFYNGKLDLSQAEALMSLIESDSVSEIKASYSQFQGSLSSAITDYQNELKSLIASIEVAVDYPEEDIEQEAIDDIEVRLKKIIDELSALIKSYDSGRLIASGVKVALIGEPNVGKSSLLNSLLGEDRAIVTDIAGTTRDTIEGSYIYNDIRFNVVDTAGIRSAQDSIEKLGIERSFKAIKDCDILVAIDMKREDCAYNKPIIFVANKMDIRQNCPEDYLPISAKCSTNIDALKEQIFEKLDINTPDIMLSSLRHYSCVTEAKNALISALASLGSAPLDCVAIDLMESFRALGAITGAVASDEIVSEIFSHFCVGK